MLASQVFVGPAFASLTGLLAAVITHFVVKEKVALKIAIPLAVAFFAFPCGLGCLVGFYEVIWPAL